MAKAAQTEVNYRLGNPTRGCSLCEMFRRSGGEWDTCTDVEGDISPFGYCDIYAKRDDPELKQLAGAKPMRGYARGGRPDVGVPSLVGEMGPEVFVPDQAGTIVPMPQYAMDWRQRGTPQYGGADIERAAGMGISARGAATVPSTTTGGTPQAPLHLENALTGYAQGKMSAKDVQKLFKSEGWKVDLRRGSYEFEATDPSGRIFYLAP